MGSKMEGGGKSSCTRKKIPEVMTLAPVLAASPIALNTSFYICESTFSSMRRKEAEADNVQDSFQSKL